jgi:hypothetical protein
MELSELSDTPVISEENGGSKMIPLVAAFMGVILIVLIYKYRVSNISLGRKE